MKKLFVSVPMKGRTEEEIRDSIKKMHKIAEVFEGEELELIDSYIEHKPPKTANESVWYLGESIKKMSEADVFIGISNHWDWRGCWVESEIANRYGLEVYSVSSGYLGINPLYIELRDECSADECTPKVGISMEASE